MEGPKLSAALSSRSYVERLQDFLSLQIHLVIVTMLFVSEAIKLQPTVVKIATRKPMEHKGLLKIPEPKDPVKKDCNNSLPVASEWQMRSFHGLRQGGWRGSGPRFRQPI